jgi:FeS assembly SUF system regulator
LFRISRLTDYGIVLLAQMASSGETNPQAAGEACPGAEGASHNARSLAAQTRLPAPAVSKILKALARAGILSSHRGAKGGYRLARAPESISVVDMITALEGPVGITECSIHPGSCAQEASCHVRDPWQRINVAVREALADVTLADLASPGNDAAHFVPLVGLHHNTGVRTSNRSEPIDV